MKFTMFPRNNSNRICSRALYSAAQIGGGGKGAICPGRAGALLILLVFVGKNFF
jgi:hypothetical protein